MPAEGKLAWWTPIERAILPVDGLKVSRSLANSVRRYDYTVDRDFGAVIEACANPARPDGWISRPLKDAYRRLHELGWAHSIETWQKGRLVGGLYGVAIGGLFAGESMFYRERDASKAALVHLARILSDGRPRLLDVQWQTPHLASLGSVVVGRSRYLQMLDEALSTPLPKAFQS